LSDATVVHDKLHDAIAETFDFSPDEGHPFRK
jgi:hypothetical protein